MADFFNPCPSCDLQLTSLSTGPQSVSVSGGNAGASLSVSLQVAGSELTGTADYSYSDSRGSGETNVVYTGSLQEP